MPVIMSNDGAIDYTKSPPAICRKPPPVPAMVVERRRSISPSRQADVSWKQHIRQMERESSLHRGRRCRNPSAAKLTGLTYLCFRVNGTSMVIVAAIDRSKRAPAVVRQAAELADAYSDELHVVHVLGRSEFLDLEQTSVDDTGQPVPMDQVREVARRIAAETTENVTASAKAVGLVGDPSDEIVRYANEQGGRYIVISGRKRSPVGKAVFGSVTQDVLLEAERPVVTVIRRDEE